ncbi:MAG: Crp/Fnr family transcriptional regulator [Gammaproteobacteria bacterium]
MIDHSQLSHIEIFRHASEKELDLLSQASVIKTFASGNMLANEGEAATHVYFILSGTCIVQLSGKAGKEIIIKDLHQGDCFGELGALCNARRCASVLTKGHTKLVIINSDAYVSYCNNNLVAAQITISKLASSLSKITKDFQSLAVDNLNHRLIRLLLEVSIKEKNKLSVRLTHNQLATRVASTRESVSRVIAELRKNGLIRTSEHEIEIDESLIELYGQL